MPLAEFLKKIDEIQSKHPAPKIVLSDDWYNLRRDFDAMVEPELSQTFEMLQKQYPNLNITPIVDGAVEILMENSSLLHHRKLPIVSLTSLMRRERVNPKIRFLAVDPFGNKVEFSEEIQFKNKF